MKLNIIIVLNNGETKEILKAVFEEIRRQENYEINVHTENKKEYGFK